VLAGKFSVKARKWEVIMKRIVFVMAFSSLCLICSLVIVPDSTAESSGRADPLIKIETSNNPQPDEYEYISITLEDIPLEMGGFDFLIAYDYPELVFMEATPGQLLEDCDWEYFNYHVGALGDIFLISLLVVADINNGPFYPLCYGPPDSDPHELAELKFYVSGDGFPAESFFDIYFFWDDCNDNSVSSVDGEILYIDRAIYDFEGNLIWDEDDDDQFPEEARIPFVGAPDDCQNPEPPPENLRNLKFKQGGIRTFICGDANSDGTVNVSDAVHIINYVFVGGEPPDLIASADVNCDGSVNISDAVWIINYIFLGGFPPCETNGDGIRDC
jgi:Dockerin type I domain